MTLEMNLFKYNDYRVYLNDFYDFQKSTRTSYTYAIFSQKAQIKSPNLLKLVIDGKKNLTNKTILSFAQALSLSPSETEYFEALVFENQAASSMEKDYYGSRLRKLKPAYNRHRTVRISSKLNLFENPLTPMTISLVVGETHESSLQKLDKQLGITKEQALKLLESYRKAGILLEQDGIFQCDFNHAIFHESPSNIQLKNFIRSHLKFAMSAFEKKYTKEAKFFSHDMAIHAEDYPKLIEQIKNFIHQINQNFDRVPGEKGVSINIQSFWLDRDLL